MELLNHVRYLFTPLNDDESHTIRCATTIKETTWYFRINWPIYPTIKYSYCWCGVHRGPNRRTTLKRTSYTFTLAQRHTHRYRGVWEAIYVNIYVFDINSSFRNLMEIRRSIIIMCVVSLCLMCLFEISSCKLF